MRAAAASVPLSDLLLGFISGLRTAGVRISVAESMDAMNAIGVAGLSRQRVREALRATLIKDERDNATFEWHFANYFDAGSDRPGGPRPSRGAAIGVSGSGKGDGAGAAAPPTRSATPVKSSAAKTARQNDAEERKETRNGRATAEATGDGSKMPSSGTRAAALPVAGGQAAANGREALAGSAGQQEELQRQPFTNYSALEYEQARDQLGLIRRRFQIRLGRRLRRAQSGRIDFRRTIHAAIQHGGAFIERRFRVRRPKHLDLLVCADISGSVRYATTLMLELIAGGRAHFRQMHALVYIDRIAVADFEGRHLVMTPNLDLYARSDFGRVLAELRDEHAELLNRATVLLIMGDGRNNRRAARADILRDIVRRCRAAIWLNPERIERWGSGDSAIENYRKVVDKLLPSNNLVELENSLLHLI